MGTATDPLRRIFKNALRLCDAEALTRAAVAVEGGRIVVRRPGLVEAQLARGPILRERPTPSGRIAVITVGKAAAGQARALGEILDPWQGLVVAPPELAGVPGPAWRSNPAAHPVPDASSVAAADAALDLAARLSRQDLLVVAISGGSSAMLAKPAGGLTLAHVAATTRALLASGADIAAVNAVRKRLSAIKGGRLAAASRAPTLCLVLSDVHDARLDLVGSGPAVPDPSSAEDARRVIDEHGLWEALPAEVATALREAEDEGWPEDRAEPEAALLADPGHLAAAAAGAAAAEGLRVERVKDSVTGPVGLLADALTSELRSLTPGSCRIWVGEPTVKLPETSGVGGRMSHLALSVAERIAGREGLAFLACGSDGVDGRSKAAGAVVDADTWGEAVRPQQALERFDSGRLLGEIGCSVVTGPTGTNFTDLMVLVRE